MSAKTQGLDKLRRKLLSQIPSNLKAAMAEANATNAAEFTSKVAGILPTDEGDLLATLTNEPEGEIGRKVAIGGPSAPYPLHLDAGHIDADSGAHVPAKPYWFVVRRTLRKRFRGRNSRAVSKALKAAATDPAP